MNKKFDFYNVPTKYPPTKGKYIVIFYEKENGWIEYNAINIEKNVNGVMLKLLFSRGGKPQRISKDMYIRKTPYQQANSVQYKHDYIVVTKFVYKALERIRPYVDTTLLRSLR